MARGPLCLVPQSGLEGQLCLSVVLTRAGSAAGRSQSPVFLASVEEGPRDAELVFAVSKGPAACGTSSRGA